MAYNVSQIKTDIRNKLDNPSFDSTLLIDFINDAQREMVNRHNFKFMEATYTGALTTGEYSFDLPTDVSEVETFRITNPSGEEIDLTKNYITYAEFDNLYPDPAEQDNGKPYRWTIRENNFLIYPAADQAYTLEIRYQKAPTVLSVNADVPDVPERFKELLVTGALARAHKFNDNYDIAQVEEAKFEKLLLDVVAKTYTRQTGRPHIMRVNGRRV